MNTFLMLWQALSWKRILYAVLAVAFVTLVVVAQLRGSAVKAEIAARKQEQAAYAAEKLAAEINVRRREAAAQAKFDEERKQWDEDKQKMETAIAGLRGNADRLRKTIDAGKAGYLSDGKDASAAGGTDAATKAAWVVLGQCVNQYEALARETDDLNSRLSIGQRWARSLDK